MGAVATSQRSAAVATAPASERTTPRLFAAEEASLEELVLGAWEDLTRDGHAACPVCGGRIALDSACGGCGAELS